MEVFYNLNIAIFFQIVFEGIVGKNSLGNIAIDDISVAPGVCPSKCFVNIVICKFTLGRKILKKRPGQKTRIRRWNQFHEFFD